MDPSWSCLNKRVKVAVKVAAKIAQSVHTKLGADCSWKTINYVPNNSFMNMWTFSLFTVLILEVRSGGRQVQDIKNYPENSAV